MAHFVENGGNGWILYQLDGFCGVCDFSCIIHQFKWLDGGVMWSVVIISWCRGSILRRS